MNIIEFWITHHSLLMARDCNLNISVSDQGNFLLTKCFLEHFNGQSVSTFSDITIHKILIWKQRLYAQIDQFRFTSL